LMVQRQEFARLIAKGVNNSEACRLVGVNRRTGTRWRFGRAVTSSSGLELHDPAMATTEATCLSARLLSDDERVLIGDQELSPAEWCTGSTVVVSSSMS
jgi:IS30 family transposase